MSGALAVDSQTVSGLPSLSTLADEEFAVRR
jgi:hypothetical protein